MAGPKEIRQRSRNHGTNHLSPILLFRVLMCFIAGKGSAQDSLRMLEPVLEPAGWGE